MAPDKETKHLWEDWSLVEELYNGTGAVFKSMAGMQHGFPSPREFGKAEFCHHPLFNVGIDWLMNKA